MWSACACVCEGEREREREEGDRARKKERERLVDFLSLKKKRLLQKAKFAPNNGKK